MAVFGVGKPVSISLKIRMREVSGFLNWVAHWDRPVFTHSLAEGLQVGMNAVDGLVPLAVSA